MIEGVEQEAKENGLPTLFVQLDYNDKDYEEQLSRIIMDANSGIILLATEMQEEDFVPFRNSKSPIVLLDGWSYQTPFNGVLINNMDSSFNAVNYLIEKGHRKIGYVCGNCRIQAFGAENGGTARR